MRLILGPVVLVLTVISFAQTPAAVRPIAHKTHKNNSSEIWLEFARGLSSEIMQDIPRTGPYQETILRARLGAAWFDADPVRARQWLNDAVARMERDATGEVASDQKDRLDAARIVLKIVTPLDRKLADRLVKLLDSKSAEQLPGSAGTEQDRTKEARDLSEAARSMATIDPQRAAQLGKLFLNMRGGTDIAKLIGSLKGRVGGQMSGVYASLLQADPKTAEQLYMQALASAQQDYDYTTLFTLSEIAFPSMGNTSQQPASPRLQYVLLNVVAEGMSQAALSDEGRVRICPIAPIASRLQAAFPPEQIAAVQNGVQICSAGFAPDEADDLQDELRELHTAEQFMFAATEEVDLRRRCHYKSKAAIRALKQEHNSEYALNIWDGFTVEEQAAYPTWAADRDEAAATAIKDFYNAHDLYGMATVIDHTPETLRPKLQLSTAGMLFTQKDESLGLWMLAQARSTLERIDVSDESVYLMLLTTYASRSPGEAAEVLQLAVDGMNRVPARKTDAHLGVLPSGYDLKPYQFGPSMLVIDHALLRSSIVGLNSPVQRACFRLGVLQMVLKQYYVEAPRSVARRSAGTH